MNPLLLLVLLLIVTSATCNTYTKEQHCSKNQPGNAVCEKTNEFEEDDDDEPMFYEMEDKLAGREPLFKWDPVRVSVYHIVFSKIL